MPDRSDDVPRREGRRTLLEQALAVICLLCLVFIVLFYVLVWYERITLWTWPVMLSGRLTRWDSPLRQVWYVCVAVVLVCLAILQIRGRLFRRRR